MITFETPLLVTFVGYTAIILTIAYVSTRLTSNLSDYVLAGRRLSGPITALGAGASDMSSWLLMALPGLVYVNGLSMIWMPVALVAGAYCNWRFMAKKLRVYTEVAGDSLTIPEFLCNRFKDQGYSLRIVTSLAIIIFFTFYAAAGLVSGAWLIQHTFAGVEYLPALFITASVIVTYTAIGGFLAVSWIDFFQGTLMFLALLVVPIVTCMNMGGLTETIETINTNSPVHLNMFDNITFLGLLSLFAWGLGYFGQLHINTRFMAIRSIRELPLARFICINWMTLALGGAVATGLFGFVFFNNQPLERQDTVFIVLAQRLFNPWIAGILLSAVISAVMSTVSAQILMSSSILVEDFYHGLFRKNASDKENLWASRIILLGVASVAISIAASPNRTIMQAVGFAWSGLGSAFGPTLLFSLFWRRMTRVAAICGIITGGGMVLLWGILAYAMGDAFTNPDILPGFEMLPGFITSCIVIYVVALRTPMPSAEVLAEFDKTNAIIAADEAAIRGVGNTVVHEGAVR
jgi:sodium/proline symporter